MQTGPLTTNLDLSGVKTATPLIAEGTKCKVKLESIEGTVSDDGKPGSKWKFTIVEPATVPSGDPVTGAPDGGAINAGFPLFVNIPFYAREDAKNPTWFKEKIARFVDALLGTGDPDNKKGKPARPVGFGPEVVTALIGKTAIADITISRSNKSDYVGNDINRLTFEGDLQP